MLTSYRFQYSCVETLFLTNIANLPLNQFSIPHFSMSRLIFLACMLSLASSQSSTPANLKKVDEKGFIDWINNLIGNSPETTLRPTNDPPPDCPTCR